MVIHKVKDKTVSKIFINSKNILSYAFNLNNLTLQELVQLRENYVKPAIINYFKALHDATPAYSPDAVAAANFVCDNYGLSKTLVNWCLLEYPRKVRRLEEYCR